MNSAGPFARRQARRKAAGFNQGAAANRRPAGQLDGSGNLAAIVAADRAFPAAVAELGLRKDTSAMKPVQQPESKPVKRGHWAVLGAALGAFIGLLLGKFAIGLISGFFVGIVIGSVKRKASASGGERPSGDEPKD